MSDAERSRRYRINFKRTHPSPVTLRKQQRRAVLEQALAESTRKAWLLLDSPDRRLFPVLYVDPPWRVEPWSRETGLNRSPDNHYPTMTLDEIKVLMAKLPAAENCTLFLWVVSELLDEIKDVCAAGGFKYRAHCMWDKGNEDGTGQMGLGHWFRYEHEVLIVADKGNVPAPAVGTQWRSVIRAPRVRGSDGRIEHSRKPEIFAEIVTAYYPNCPKHEMFYRPLDNPAAEAERRAKREAAGWDSSWGNEAPPEPVAEPMPRLVVKLQRHARPFS